MGCAQVLSPMRKGPAGVANLNVRLQQLLNPPCDARPELVISSAAAERPQILRAGDRVIQARAWFGTDTTPAPPKGFHFYVQVFAVHMFKVLRVD